MMNTGKLAKLLIKGFTDNQFEIPTSPSQFQTLLNPESVNIGHSISYNKAQASGTTGVDALFNRVNPSTLSMQLVFDGTGVVPGSRQSNGDPINAESQLTRFEEITYSYNGESHEPNHVVVNWGRLSFRGVVESIDYDYKLFKKDGEPIRILANVRFTGSIDQVERAAFENKNSPDLTHLRLVKEGDNLPLMCKRIYGDPKYYLEVAKANQLTNFRKLTPGQQINFPPIEKLTT